ncbi:hypothetical protein C457_16107 [Haloferax prahovense DSM 18310]|uniref:DUF7998 domain-containing protein n=1 Tax=Haloferax prahovense (strain DSM 18310 / JCM 13924 / TL6) TaxID=1227461 RepID=M0G4E7_HALPT|nr:hypothetical protein [Haloferax prahovense]ELZ65679.1 hypothetical protein C457_16107 [Haloferax prahovense DSM 18310]
MPDISSLFGGGSRADRFDDSDQFVPEHLPDPDAFLDGHRVLEGDDHVAVHRVARELFEDRGVYDVTFGYNLARLNLDRRHPNAGFRYAEDRDDPSVLRAEFTPTTPFCPQSKTLTVGAFRAWNGLADRHDYDRVRVRVAPMHQQAGAINAELDAMDAGDAQAETDGSTTDAGTPTDERDDESDPESLSLSEGFEAALNRLSGEKQ